MMKILIGLFLFAGCCFFYKWSNHWCIIYLSVVNLLTFFVFGFDKLKARAGWWRITENTLHFFTAIGGTLGMLFGEAVFHHKRIKSSFKRVSYAIVFFQILIVAGFFYYLYLQK